MTKEQVIELAKQAGASRYTNRHYPDRPTHTFTAGQLELYTALVRNAALEQAAKRFDDLNLYGTKAADTQGVAVILRNLKEPTP